MGILLRAAGSKSYKKLTMMKIFALVVTVAVAYVSAAASGCTNVAGNCDQQHLRRDIRVSSVYAPS